MQNIFKRGKKETIRLIGCFLFVYPPYHIFVYCKTLELTSASIFTDKTGAYCRRIYVTKVEVKHRKLEQ